MPLLWVICDPVARIDIAYLCTKYEDFRFSLLFLSVKFNFCRKKTATKFLCVKSSSGRVVATSFLYLTVHRWIVGDVSMYLKYALSDTPLTKRRFWQISLNSAAAVRANKKIKLSLIRSQQCAFHSAIDEPYVLPLNPPKGLDLDQ